MPLSKQDIEEIGKVVESKLVFVDQNVRELRRDVDGLREQIQSLTISLDRFLKQLADYKDEFIILKTEVDQIKKILKEKLGVDVLAQG